MNLYDLMGPVAVSAGAAMSYGVESAHGHVVWLSILVGAVVGCGAFLGLRRICMKARDGLLPAIYIATPVCVLAATVFGSWVVRVIV